jgi:hypothetical protein
MENRTQRRTESDLDLRSTGRRIVAASATVRTGKNSCRQPAKVVDVDHQGVHLALIKGGLGGVDVDVARVRKVECPR